MGKMILQQIDECCKDGYDFFYLPIDFRNKCNVGYAFMNMKTPEDILPLYAHLNNKKWARFNSEKVCVLTYGRIQGFSALTSHFQRVSLRHEDKRRRPPIFKKAAIFKEATAILGPCAPSFPSPQRSRSLPYSHCSDEREQPLLP